MLLPVPGLDAVFRKSPLSRAVHPCWKLIDCWPRRPFSPGSLLVLLGKGLQVIIATGTFVLNQPRDQPKHP